jgi:hypothetical protein
MQYHNMAIALAATLTLTAIAASPADAARRHSRHHHHGWHGRAVASGPYGFGSGAVISGHLTGPQYGARFGYGYDRFDADFDAYTHGYRGAYAAAPGYRSGR